MMLKGGLLFKMQAKDLPPPQLVLQTGIIYHVVTDNISVPNKIVMEGNQY